MDGHPGSSGSWTKTRLQADSPSTRTFVENRVENDSNVTQSALVFSDATRQDLAARVRNREHYVAVSPARSAPNSGARRDRSAHQGRSSGTQGQGRYRGGQGGAGEVCRRVGRWDSDRENDGHGERNAPGIPGPLQEGRAYAIDH